MAAKTVQSEHVECPQCGHNEKEITYYDALAPTRTCTRCGHSW